MAERGPDRKAARQAYARRNAWALLALFGGAVAFGLWLGNWAALLGGALGLGWVLLAHRKP